MAEPSPTCTLPGCRSGPCRVPAPLILADRSEVPAGCPNRLDFTDPEYELPRSLHAREVYITPAAAEAASVTRSRPDRFELLALLRAGRLLLLVPRVKHPIMAGGAGAQPLVEPPAEPPEEPPQAEVGWVRFRVVYDEDSRPLANVRLKIKLPDGRIESRATNSTGYVEFQDVPDGTCEILEMREAEAVEVLSVVSAAE